MEFYSVQEFDEIELRKQVGKNIRKRRKELSLSQETLSFDADIPKNQVGRIERGEINTTISTLYKLSIALKIDIKDLLIL